MADFTMVFFDLKTTDLSTQRCHIIQLGAVCGKRTFNAYLVPQRRISNGAYRLNGFHVLGGVLYRRKEAMLTVSLNRALNAFIRFLKSLGRPACLAAHNANCFDVPILQRLLWRFNYLRKSQRVVIFYLDTLPLGRRIHFDLKRHSLEELSRHHGRSYNGEDALEDAKLLQEIYTIWDPTRNLIRDFLREW